MKFLEIVFSNKSKTQPKIWFFSKNMVHDISQKLLANRRRY